MVDKDFKTGELQNANVAKFCWCVKDSRNEAHNETKAHIVSFLAKEVLAIEREQNSTKNMWKALENIFAKKSIGTQSLLRKQLNHLKLEGGKSMRAHLMAFEDLIR